MIERIRWMTYEPINFPCFLCHKGYGKWKRAIELDDGVRVNLCVCDDCVQLQDALVRVLLVEA